MAQTRAQGGRKDQEPEQATVNSTKKRSHNKIEESKQKEQKSSKKTKQSQTKNGMDVDVEAKLSSSGASKVDRLIREVGSVPLSNTKLSDPTKPNPETVLALLLNAML